MSIRQILIVPAVAVLVSVPSVFIRGKSRSPSPIPKTHLVAANGRVVSSVAKAVWRLVL